jgi:uncharacterized membrane protein
VKANSKRYLHVLLLLVWTCVGLILRLTNLTAKPLWTDEFSTIVFSLGNSFLNVPLDEVLSLSQLLEPLQPQAQASLQSVLENLFSESNHPPLFFMLAHLWLKLFPVTAEGYVSTQAARSLSALLGVISIPTTFLLGWFSFRSKLVGHIAAILMATSPFGVYLAQEARHYTLSILWVTASLSCLIMATRTIRDRTLLPLWVCLTWIIVNGLGIATHYFFAITLGAEALVISTIGLVQSWRERGVWYPAAHWQRIWFVVIGTIVSGLVWLPMLQEIQDSELTRWIRQGERSGLVWLEPIAQAIAGWVTMLYLLPIQAVARPVVITCGVILILLVLWTIPKLYRGLQVQNLERNRRLTVWSLACFVIGAIALFFGITYLFSTNLTSAFRYNFVYFPAVIVLSGAGLASSWNIATQIAQTPADQVSQTLLNLIRTSGRSIVILVTVLSLIGGLTVVLNLGYQKTHRPDIVAQHIVQRSEGSVLVAIAHQTHGQTGRLMGIAWSLLYPPSSDWITIPFVDFSQSNLAANNPAPAANSIIPYFLLAHQTQNPRALITSLRKAFSQLPSPLDLWLVNFQGVPEQPLNIFLEKQNCKAETKNLYTDGYRYRLYHCEHLNFPEFKANPKQDEKNTGGR